MYQIKIPCKGAKGTKEKRSFIKSAFWGWWYEDRKVTNENRLGDEVIKIA